MSCVMMIGLEVGKFTSLHVVCDDDNFGSLDVWTFTYCVVMMISLEVWRFTCCV